MLKDLEPRFTQLRENHALRIDKISSELSVRLFDDSYVKGTVVGTAISRLETFIDQEGWTAILFDSSFEDSGVLEFDMVAEFELGKSVALTFFSKNQAFGFDADVKHEDTAVGAGDFAYGDLNPHVNFSDFGIYGFKNQEDAPSEEFKYEISDDGRNLLDCEIGLRFADRTEILEKIRSFSEGSSVKVTIGIRYDEEDFGTVVSVGLYPISSK